jgi:Putative motility protein
MDVSSVASVATSMSQHKTADAVDTTVLRKALDVAASSAQQLIESVPKPKSVSNPEHLGQSVDVTA